MLTRKPETPGNEAFQALHEKIYFKMAILILHFYDKSQFAFQTKKIIAIAVYVSM